MNSGERSGTQADHGTWARVVTQCGVGRRRVSRMEGVKASR